VKPFSLGTAGTAAISPMALSGRSFGGPTFAVPLAKLEARFTTVRVTLRPW
jgi:hypothetical protein